jgi:hypothetical protein
METGIMQYVFIGNTAGHVKSVACLRNIIFDKSPLAAAVRIQK